MMKIPSLFERDYEGTRLVFDKVVEGAEWVVNGDGVATRKFDGTSCFVDGNGILHRRHALKVGKPMPEGWTHWSGDLAQQTGHGWVPVNDHASDAHHMQGLIWTRLQSDWDGAGFLPPGTYELCGPKVQGNPEGFDVHRLIPHTKDIASVADDVMDNSPFLDNAPRDFEGLKVYLDGGGMEGIVWHHKDGRMVKIKAKDFGVKR